MLKAIMSPNIKSNVTKPVALGFATGLWQKNQIGTDIALILHQSKI